MKRLIIYCLLLAVVCIVPTKRQDVADLEPVQAVWLSTEDGQVTLETDTGDQGMGETVEEALEQMKKESLGIIYLDTAQYLLVSEEGLDYVEQMRPWLKGKVLVCRWDGGEIKDAAKYQQSHEMGIKLSKWNENVTLPKLPI